MHITYRPAAPSDAAQLLEYLKTVGSETDYLTFGAEGIPFTPEQETALLERFAESPHSRILLALDGDRIVGNGCVDGSGKPRLRHRRNLAITVLRDYWGRGVGSGLMERMISFACETGATLLTLEVRTDNERAKALYRRFGFRVCGRIPHYCRIGGQYYDVDSMALCLDPAREDAPAAPAGSRSEIVGGFYQQYDEDGRLLRSRQGQLEFRTTMAYIHRFTGKRTRVLELGAGTGRYSIALAKEGLDVTAVELVERNLAVLRENAGDLPQLHAVKGDATRLERFADDSFDLTLVFGPMYHLYTPDEIQRAINEAIRVTKPGGVLLFSFLSVYGILYANHLYGDWAVGQAENFTADGRVRHFKEQLFTGYDVAEFERLFADKPVEWITTAGVDGPLEAIERRPDFRIPDRDFEQFAAWYLTVAEKRELLGDTNHLLYICRKRS